MMSALLCQTHVQMRYFCELYRKKELRLQKGGNKCERMTTAKRRTKVQDLHKFPDTAWQPPSGTISLFHSWLLAPQQLTSLGKEREVEKQTSVQCYTVALHYILKEGHICPTERGIGWGRFPGTYEGLSLGARSLVRGAHSVGGMDIGREESWPATVWKAGLAQRAGSGMLINHLRQQDSQKRQKLICCLSYDPI